MTNNEATQQKTTYYPFPIGDMKITSTTMENTKDPKDFLMLNYEKKIWGTIEFNEKEKKYVFSPQHNTQLDIEALQDIIDFLKEQTKRTDINDPKRAK